MAIRVTNVVFQALVRPAILVDATNSLTVDNSAALIAVCWQDVVQPISIDGLASNTLVSILTGEGVFTINGVGSAIPVDQFFEDIDADVEASALHIIVESVTESFSIGQTISAGHTANLSATLPLIISQTLAVTGPWYASGAEAFTLDVTAVEYEEPTNDVFESATSTFTVQNSATATGPWSLTALTEVLVLNNSDCTGPWYDIAVSEFATYETEFDPETFEFYEVPTGLSTTVTLTTGSTSLSILQAIPLQQFVSGWVVTSDAISETLSQAFTLSHAAMLGVYDSALVSIAFAQQASAFVGPPGLHGAVDAQNSAGASAIMSGAASNAFSIGVSVRVQHVTEATRCIPDIVLPPANGTGFKLEYPPTSTTHTVTLRSPTFGNTQRMSGDRIKDESRGGTLIVYADPIWPKINVLSFSHIVNREVALELQAFMDDTLGKNIALTDHENRRWVGVILDFGSMTEDSRGRYAVNFEFEGERDV